MSTARHQTKFSKFFSGLFKEARSCHIPTNWTRNDALKHLRKEHHLSRKAATTEMEGLDALQATLLATFYQLGLRGHHITRLRKDYPQTTDQIAMILVLDGHRSNYFHHLVTQNVKRGCDYETVLSQLLAECATIDSEDESRISFLFKHYDDGVRNEHLPKDFTEEFEKQFNDLYVGTDVTALQALSQLHNSAKAAKDDENAAAQESQRTPTLN